MKKIVIIVLSITIGIVWLAVLFNIEKNKKAAISDKAQALLHKAEVQLNIGAIDSALILLYEVNKIKIKGSPIQKASELSEKIMQYKKDIENQYYKEYLGGLSNNEYKAVLDKSFIFNRFNQPYLDSVYKVLIYEHRLLRPVLLKEQVQELKEKATAVKKRAIDTRIAFGEILRTGFLNQNMDVKVKIYGDDYKYLKLTNIVFNDIWAHKFKKEGLISQWFELGFTRIYIQDGYDYSIYYHE